MFADHALVGAIDQTEQDESDHVKVVDLADERKNVRYQVERRNDVDDRRREQGFFGQWYANILEQTAKQQNHIRQKHQKAAHAAFDLRLFTAFQFSFGLFHRIS